MKRIIATVGLLIVSASATIAADAPKVSLQAQQMPIKDAMAQISKQAGVQVICETGVKGEITGSFSDMDLEKLLDMVTAGGKIAWRKVYLPTTDDKKPTIEQIKSRVDSLRAIGDLPIAVYDPATKKETLYVSQEIDSVKITPESIGLKPVYLVSDVPVEQPVVKPAAGTATGNLADVKVDPKIEKQFRDRAMERIGMLNALPADQRAKLVQDEMIDMMKMDPSTLASLVKAQRDARNQMPQQLRDQYRQTMRAVNQLVGGGMGGGRGNGGPRRGGGQRGG